MSLIKILVNDSEYGIFIRYKIGPLNSFYKTSYYRYTHFRNPANNES